MNENQNPQMNPGAPQGATKTCKYCRMLIPKRAKVCPNCRRALKSHGCLISLLSFIMFIGIIIAIIIGSAGQNKLIQQQASGVSDEDEYITLNEYNAVDTGMSSDDVKEIIGSSGEISSQVEANGIKIIIVTWYGNGMAGLNANITFTNDEVSGKAQVGLQ